MLPRARARKRKLRAVISWAWRRGCEKFLRVQARALFITVSYIPFSHTKFTRSPSKLSFGTGSTRLRLLRGNRTSHAHNHDLCKGGARDAAQMQPRERMQLHQPTHGTLLTHTSPPIPFFGFFFFFFSKQPWLTH